MSICGMFVAIPSALAVGDKVLVRLPARDDAEPVQIHAEVRWLRAAPDGAQRPAGVGLRYTDPLWEVVSFVGLVLRQRP
jgi:Tfp pilus assembly protein PilZ